MEKATGDFTIRHSTQGGDMVLDSGTSDMIFKVDDTAIGLFHDITGGGDDYRFEMQAGYNIRLGHAKTATGDVSINGYLILEDSTGTEIKVATVA